MSPDDLDEEMAVYNKIQEDIWKEGFQPFPQHAMESDEEESNSADPCEYRVQLNERYILFLRSSALEPCANFCVRLQRKQL